MPQTVMPEKELVIYIRELEIFGFRRRSIPRAVCSFVRISVDGDQFLDTPQSLDTLTPIWVFDKPLQMMVRASSLIKFSVYYKGNPVLPIAGKSNCFCGEVRMELQDVLVDPYAIHRLECPIYSRETNLEFRVKIELKPSFQHDTLLLRAEERLQQYDSHGKLKRKSNAMSLIGLAVDSLDQIVGIVDGLVEIHPVCKLAWMVLGSVYKAFKDQHALSHQANNLASELKETLAYAKECRDLKAIPEATDVLLEIAKLVVQSAAAFDAHIKYSIAARASMSVATKEAEKRIAECEKRMKALRKKLHEVLPIRIWQGQNELLAHHKDNSSTQSLPRTYSTNWPDRSALYVPLNGLYKPGYSPPYLSSPPADEPHEPLRCPSPPPAPLILRDDGCRRFTSSPEPMPLDLPLSMPTPPFAFGSSSLLNPYGPMPSMWSPRPIASQSLLGTYTTNRPALSVPLEGLLKPGFSPLSLWSPPSDEPYLSISDSSPIALDTPPSVLAPLPSIWFSWPIASRTPMVLEMTKLKVERWCSVLSHVIVKVDLNGPQALGPRSAFIPLDATSTWEQDTSVTFSNLLAIRPSSRLNVEIHNINHTSDTTRAVFQTSVRFVDLIASSKGGTDIVYHLFDDNDGPLLTFLITATVHCNPKSLDLESEDLVHNPAVPGPREASSPVGTHKLAVIANNLLTLLKQHRQGLSPMVYSFLISFASVSACATENDEQTVSNSLGTSAVDDHNTVLQDLMMQIAITIQSLNDRTSSGEGLIEGALFNALFEELCRWVGLIEAFVNFEQDRELQATEERRSSVDLRDLEYIRKRQERLFLLVSATAIQAYGDVPMSQTDAQNLDYPTIVKQLLDLSKGEFQNLITSILASPRGAESDHVFTTIEELLKQASDAASRDVYRRALIRLVQAADRLPSSLWIAVNISTGYPFEAGSFARVYKGEITSSGLNVAIKAPHVDVMLSSHLESRMRLYSEIIFWKTVIHPRLLPFLGLAAQPYIGNMCMVSPFMQKGTLKANCDSKTFPVTRLRYITEVVQGMAYLHEEGVVHGDLRAVNIFVDDNDHIVIADFGLSLVADGLSKGFFSARDGNERWFAPELLAPWKYHPTIGNTEGDCDEESQNIVPPSTRPTRQSDVYTFSCLCSELYTGQAPFQGRDPSYVREFVPRPYMKRPPRPTSMSDQFWELTQECWHDEAFKRPSFREIEARLSLGNFE